MPTGDTGKRQAEAFAALAQTVDGAFERLQRPGRNQAPAQYAARREQLIMIRDEE
jgi:hypothetical protein